MKIYNAQVNWTCAKIKQNNKIYMLYTTFCCINKDASKYSCLGYSFYCFSKNVMCSYICFEYVLEFCRPFLFMLILTTRTIPAFLAGST